jgi:hypothetical protein
VRFRKRETKVLRNDVYDLEKDLVKEIALDGTVEEKKFDQIILIAQEK